MHRRLIARIFLCQLLMAVHSHCVWSHGAELLREVEASKCAESPIEDKGPCENEAGCICKGATRGEKLDVSLAQLVPAVWPTHDDVEAVCSSPPKPDQDLDRSPEPALPPNGTAARALLQSFQI